jgi:hypothetical protein
MKALLYASLTVPGMVFLRILIANPAWFLLPIAGSAGSTAAQSISGATHSKRGCGSDQALAARVSGASNRAKRRLFGSPSTSIIWLAQ